jgi:four helix bundle protein
VSLAESFEDLEIWQDSQDLAVRTYRDFGPESAAARDFGFVNQIRSAAVSVSNNIAEGFECASRKEFERFLVIAKRSCGEVRSMQLLAARLGYLGTTVADERIVQTAILSRRIAAFIRSLNR